MSPRVALTMLLGVSSLSRAAVAEPRCELGKSPWLEGRVEGRHNDQKAKPARAIDARAGETIDVFLASPGRLNGRAVVFGESGAAGRVSWAQAGCGPSVVTWRRVEPRMKHQETPSPNKDMALYANAVIFGPRHGTWIGFDHLEYFETPLNGASGWSLAVADATPTDPIARRRPPPLLPLGTMRLAAEISAGGRTVHTPAADAAPGGQVADSVFRYSFRRGDDFVGWLTSYFNVPYVFGSAGKGARSQAERRVGADCADVLVAALRRAGASRLEYSSVMDLVSRLPHGSSPVRITPCAPGRACPPTAPALRFGTDVRPGDFLALDYIDASELPRPWDHIVAVVEDRGPGGKPDGVLGPEDLVADSGDEEGLKFAPLAEQGPVRVMVLRPSPPVAAR
jgi:hypothetical protein